MNKKPNISSLKFPAVITIVVGLLLPARGTEPACDTPLAADYDGDNKCDPVVHTRSVGSWQARLSEANYVLVSFTLGAEEFTPVAADFDGDAKADPAVVHDKTGAWLINLSGSDYTLAPFLLGGTGWTAVPADFDGDAKADPAAYETSTGAWRVCPSQSGYAAISIPSFSERDACIAMPGDFDGDAKADPAVYGNGIWRVLLSGQNYSLVTLMSGTTSGVPFAVDFDGDAKADPTVVQENSGLWAVNLSGANYARFGLTLGGTGSKFMAADLDSDARADPAVYDENTGAMTARLSALRYEPLSLAMVEPPAKRVLILYDSTGIYGWWGNFSCRMLENLLSHFKLPYRSKPVEDYQTGDLAPYAALFYIGAVYANPLPAAFCDDVMAATNTVCWMGNNLWQIAWTTNFEHRAEFLAKFGFRYDGTEPGYTGVEYKNTSLPCSDPYADLGLVSHLESNRAAVYATATRTPEAGTTPYITRGSNLWFVADNPLTASDMADYTLVFSDLLHDILDIYHPTNHRAFIRIEDVNPHTGAGYLQSIGGYLFSRSIPFVISLIPEYRDPLGIAHQGFPTHLSLSDNPDLVQALAYSGAAGGQIILHGYTHQYDSTPNPIGTTAADYEFYRVIASNGANLMLGPVAEDSPLWAYSRVVTGKALVEQQGLSPIAWLTPHYLASEMDYGVFPAIFRLALDRGQYFALSSVGALQNMELVAPFVLHRDVYGQKRLPETIGYISPTEGIYPSNLIARAEANLVVRDGWAGCYYHWFLGTNHLPELITGVTNLGYRFIAIDPDME